MIQGHCPACECDEYELAEELTDLASSVAEAVQAERDRCAAIVRDRAHFAKSLLLDNTSGGKARSTINNLSEAILATITGEKP